MHFGIKNSNPLYFEYFAKFFDHLFKYVDENEINTIVQLGDLVDKRKSIDYLALFNLKKMFLDPCASRNISLHVISGNHDCYYKSTNEINSVRLLKIPSMEVYDTSIETVLIHGRWFDFFPWITEEGTQTAINRMKETKSDYAVGHFEFANFRLHKNQIADSGMDHTLCSKYKLCFSGHYHTISRKDSVLYCGTPFEIDWNDLDDKKGFWVFDCEQEDLEFVLTPFKLFRKIIYDDTKPFEYNETVFEQFVKLQVVKKTKPRQFESFLQNLQLQKPHEIKIIDEDIEIAVSESLKSEVTFQTTPAMINFVIDGMETTLSKDILKRKISDIYAEAEEIAEL
jgi:DNA repair exonuclease SbcCD nuclease subunit